MSAQVIESRLLAWQTSMLLLYYRLLTWVGLKPFDSDCKRVGQKESPHPGCQALKIHVGSNRVKWACGTCGTRIYVAPKCYLFHDNFRSMVLWLYALGLWVMVPLWVIPRELYHNLSQKMIYIWMSTWGHGLLQFSGFVEFLHLLVALYLGLVHLHIFQK